jgi:hypothetical protein
MNTLLDGIMLIWVVGSSISVVDALRAEGFE